MLAYFNIIIFFNVFLLLFHEKLATFINTYDKPDNIRKFHKFPVPLSGGLIIMINYIIYFFFIINFSNQQFDFKNLYTFLTPLFFFVIGFFDDKYTITASKKLFLLSIFTITFLLINESFLISQLNFHTFNKTINLNFTFSLFFTTLCILLFINALNMFDGINLQASFYCLSLFLFFAFKNYNYILSLTIMISLILFIILNFRNKSFLGDSGVYLLGFLISFIIISNYNLKNTIKIEEIFILMSIPGIDMFRLFIVRLVKKRHPFVSDRNHIHHIILKKFKFNNYLFILPTFFIFLLYVFYLNTKNIYLVFFFIISYFFIIFLKKNYKK